MKVPVTLTQANKVVFLTLSNEISLSNTTGEIASQIEVHLSIETTECKDINQRKSGFYFNFQNTYQVLFPNKMASYVYDEIYR